MRSQAGFFSPKREEASSAESRGAAERSRKRPDTSLVVAEVRSERDKEEARLLRAFLAGDNQAFVELTHRLEDALFAFCHRMLGRDLGIEDILQDIFLRVVRSAHTWKPTASVRTWIFSIARNLCYDELRKPLSESIDVEYLEDRNRKGPEADLESQRIRVSIHYAVAALPEKQREVFLLKEEGQLTFKEVAEVLDIPIDTAKSRMRYALRDLRDRLRRDGVTR